MKCFAVYDLKVAAYLNPIFFRTSAEAIRAFETSCKDSNTQFFQYPSDFQLFDLGSFDINSGDFDLHAKPVPIAHAAEFAYQNIPLETEKQLDKLKNNKQQEFKI